MVARKGRHWGVRNLGLTETVTQPAPIMVICGVELGLQSHKAKKRGGGGGKDVAYHGPVDIPEEGLSMKAIVDARDKAPPDQADNADIVKLVPDATDPGRMIADGMIGGTHAQTSSGATKEARKGQDVSIARVLEAQAQLMPEIHASENGDDGTNQVSPDVHGLIVDIRKTGKGTLVAVCFWPVA